jgi:hypothetical protein
MERYSRAGEEIGSCVGAHFFQYLSNIGHQVCFENLIQWRCYSLDIKCLETHVLEAWSPTSADSEVVELTRNKV